MAAAGTTKARKAKATTMEKELTDRAAARKDLANIGRKLINVALNGSWRDMEKAVDAVIKAA
jgi:hypothetical protein